MRSKVERFTSKTGARIYRIPLDLFPILSGFAHLVCIEDVLALVDVGSGFLNSNAELEAGLETIASAYGEKASWEDLTHILITHGHIDHFGGLHFVRERTKAKIGIHELDLRVLAHYEERLVIVERRLRKYLFEAGVPDEEIEGIMRLYLLNKNLFSSLVPDFTFEAAGMKVGPLQMIHVPGHCPGHVVIKVGDVLLTGDHILEKTSPHQAPECLSLHTGLTHYLDSLVKVRSIADHVHLTLGGHEGPISDLAGRIAAIEKVHEDRLADVFQLLLQPMTIADLADSLFPDVEGYNKLLALEETGAHVEYLSQRGYIEISNTDDLEALQPLPIQYRQAEDVMHLTPNHLMRKEKGASIPEKITLDR